MQPHVLGIPLGHPLCAQGHVTRALKRHRDRHRQQAWAQAAGNGCLHMRTHRALRVAISRDPLDRLGGRLANGRSELDTEHLHAAWRAWERAASSKERPRLRSGLV